MQCIEDGRKVPPLTLALTDEMSRWVGAKGHAQHAGQSIAAALWNMEQFTLTCRLATAQRSTYICAPYAPKHHGLCCEASL